MAFQKLPFAIISLLMLISMMAIQSNIAIGAIQVSQSISLTGVIQQTPIATYSYNITISGSNYLAINGKTGQIDYQSTNATQVINNAIGNPTQAGGNILLSSGTYNLNGSITGTNKNNITLAFANGATLFVANGMDAPAIILYSCSNWLIQSVTINGNAANQNANLGEYNGPNGIVISGQNSEVANAVIYNVRVFGVFILNPATNCGVINSKLTFCGWNGIQLGNTGLEESCYAINNEIAYCGDVGVTCQSLYSIVQNNYIHDMNGTSGFNNANWGIGIEYGGGDLITGNTLQNCPIGIYDNGFSNNTISNNIVRCDSTYSPNSGSYGIFLGNSGYEGPSSKNNSITGNTITGIYAYRTSNAGGIGINLWGSSYNSISNNTIYNCGNIGIYFDSNSNNNVINSNTISDTKYGGKGMGIDVAGSINFISQNQVFDDRSGISRTQQFGLLIESGATNNILQSNNVYNNMYGNIFDMGTFTITNAILQTITIGATVTTGQVLYNNSGIYYLANAVSPSTMNAVGLTTQSVSSGGQCTIITQGYFTNPSWSWTVGGALYVSTTPGSLTQTQPSGSGNVIEYVGYAVSATEIYFSP